MIAVTALKVWLVSTVKLSSRAEMIVGSALKDLKQGKVSLLVIQQQHKQPTICALRAQVKLKKSLTQTMLNGRMYFLLTCKVKKMNRMATMMKLCR